MYTIFHHFTSQWQIVMFGEIYCFVIGRYMVAIQGDASKEKKDSK
jgi:hypothetical protein